MNECLHVDDRIQRIGIPIVSCCYCCSLNRKYEDMEHIFATGEFAKAIWHFCYVNIGVPLMEGKPWKDRIACWQRRANLSSSTNQLMSLVPSILIWKFWVRRCKARME